MRMRNENIAACKSATLNKAVHKECKTKKKCNMKILLHKKEKVKHRNSAV